MAEKESLSSMAKLYAELSAPWRHGIKEMVASYIDTSEKLAKGALSFQEKATAWTKDTPWALFFRTQNAMASQFVEGTASLARKLWRIEEDVLEEAEKRAEGETTR